MDLRQIKNLMKEFEVSTIHKLEITDDQFSIKLEKEEVKSYSAPMVAPSIGITNPVLPVKEQNQEVEKVNDYIEVKSPLVGTYYDSPSPDASPFVKPNDNVKKGDTLFIIEAMKVMNEITAPIDGKVMNILCEDSDLVEFGQVVIEIKP